MGDIIATLNPIDIISSTTRWINPLFNELLPIALVGLGIITAGLFVAWLVNMITNAIGKLFGHKEEIDYHQK